MSSESSLDRTLFTRKGFARERLERERPTRESARSTGLASARFGSNPWVQLGLGVICMAMVANLQYGWTIFVNPIDAKYHWGKTAIQVAFTLFILFETWLVPFEAYLADRFGPRPLVLAGGLLIAASWTIYARASTLGMLYAGGVVGGLGTGLVYGTCMGNALKWFGKRRGLAAGFTSAGYGAGAAITVLPLMRSLASRGYEATLFHFALIQGGIVLVVGLALRKPSGMAASRSSNPRLLQTTVDRSPLETLASPVFWLMYAAYVLVAASGLMITAELGPIAGFFGIAQSPVAVLGWTLPALTLALSLNNLMNGVGRPLFGWMSDAAGREFTLCVTFVAGGTAILFIDLYGRNPAGFVILAGVVFLTWDIYSIFPALTSDHFGKKYASTNYALLYTAKGTAALFVPLGSLLAARTKSWNSTLLVAALANLAALLIVGIMRPLRVRELRQWDKAR